MLLIMVVVIFWTMAVIMWTLAVICYRVGVREATTSEKTINRLTTPLNTKIFAVAYMDSNDSLKTWRIVFKWKRKGIEWMVWTAPKSRRRFSSFPASFYQIFFTLVGTRHLRQFWQFLTISTVFTTLGNFWQCVELWQSLWSDSIRTVFAIIAMFLHHWAKPQSCQINLQTMKFDMIIETLTGCMF